MLDGRGQLFQKQDRTLAGKRFVAGVVLYDGEVCARFGEGLFALPLRMLWELT